MIFFLLKLRNIFEGLIGLYQSYDKIKLFFHETQNNLNMIVSTSEQVKKIKSSIRNGEVITSHKNFTSAKYQNASQ